MGLSLEEYAQQHPLTEKEQEELEAERQPAKEETRQRRSVEDLKQGILAQIRQGDEPQYILYAALEVIGILSEDPIWAELGQSHLNYLYGDLRQRALFRDDVALVHERLEQQRANFLDHLLKKTQREHRKAQQIADELDALQIRLQAAQLPQAEDSEDLDDF